MQLFQSIEGGSFVNVQSTNYTGGVLTFEVERNPDYDYSFKARAASSLGNGAFSEEATVRSSGAATIPEPPTDVVVSSVGSSSFMLNWTLVRSMRAGVRARERG